MIRIIFIMLLLLTANNAFADGIDTPISSMGAIDRPPPPPKPKTAKDKDIFVPEGTFVPNPNDMPNTQKNK